MSPTRRHAMSRWRRRSAGILVLLLFSPALVHAATPEETLGRAVRGMLALGEGQVSEAIYAAPGGVTSEADLPLVARARYTYKAPRVRVEVTDAASKALRLVVHDGKEAWLITQVGATRLSEAAAEVRRTLSEQAFPVGLAAAGARLGGTETIGGRSAQVVEGTGPDGAWSLWVDVADGRLLRYRLRGGEQVGDLTYGSGGVLRKVTLKNAQGQLVLVRFRDVPAKMAVEDKVFSFEQAKGGSDLGQALARGLTSGRTQGPAVTATAGARGVDEEVQHKQLGKMRLDYQALADVERFRVNEADVESFLRAGRLGRYRE
jgi:outer membrane lipoprotein-sorting protein